MKTEIKKLENSEIEIVGSIPFEDLEKHRSLAVEKLGANISVDGFRKGKVPEKIIIEKVGEDAILNEMAELTLQLAYPEIIVKNKIDAITSPQITITKIAMGNPLEFKIKVTVMPEISLPDYNKIAEKEMGKKEDAIEVTKEELEKTIEQIQKNQKHIKKEGEEVTKEDLEKDKNELPELNDEFVKKLGDFKDVEDFKNKIKENIKHEKKHKQKEAKRIAILDQIIKETKVELPKILVEVEIRKMLAEMQENITRMGLQFDKYLEQIKKTEDDLKKEWRMDAEKRVKGQLVLNKIYVNEKLSLDESEVKKNVDILLSQYKNAKKENVEVYVKMMLANGEVFRFFENKNK